MSRLVLVFGVVAAMSASAFADEPAPEMTGKDVRVIGGGYQLYFGGDQLRVRKGKRNAPLTIGEGSPSSYSIIGVKAAGKAVTLSYMPACEDVTVTYSHDQLAARLDYEEGARLAKKNKHAAAEKLLAHAVALDPGFEGAVRDHARTLVKLGRLDDAAGVLASRLAANPMDEYARIALDPQLAALLEHPTLAKLRAAAPGTAKIDDDAVSVGASGVAKAPGGQLAFVESIGSHGACWSTTWLRIRDGKGLFLLAEVPLAVPGDYNGDGCEGPSISAAGQRRIRGRAAAANQILAALGFAPLEGEVTGEAVDARPGVRTLRFAKSAQSLVVGSDGAARLFQGGKMLVEHPPGSANLENVTWAVLVPSEQRIFFRTWSAGCEHAESSWMSAIATK